MQYLFILGRNPELSLAELKCYFGNFKYIKNKNAVLAELPELKKGIISRFGGIIAIGKVLASENDFEKDISGKILYTGFKNNFNYVIWDFSNSGFLEYAKGYLKHRFKEEKLKATEKKISNFMKMQSGEEMMTLSSNKLIDEQYFVFEDKFGKIIETCDYGQLEKNDMEKPVRREKLAISPRLAKIMINLSKADKNETIVDCFCGIGVIVKEALRLEINVIGIDKDPDAIKGILENLKWGKFSEKNYEIVQADSGKIKIKKSSALVAEPDFGETLKSIPEDKKTELIMRNYENLMIRVLNNLKGSIAGRFVFTAPLIQTRVKNRIKRISCNKKRILENTGLKIIEGFPISEFRENQIVGREIMVLQH